MSISKSKELLKNSGIEFSPDEQVLALIDANTHNTIGRAANNAYKCIALVAGGTPLKTASRLTGIPRATLQSWRSKPWYAEAVEIIRKQLDEQLDGRMTHIVNKGIKKLEQRLDEGDAVVQRDGSLVYKPVSARDTAIISSIFFDKRNLLRNKPTSITSNQSTAERLAELKDRFKEIAIEAEYTVITDDSANYEVNHDVEGIEAQTYADNQEAIRGQLGSNIQKESGEGADQSSEEDSSPFTFKAS